tara:strand:- start:6469 stop:7254 length:786 start_codon:yes stop_codon:yes gene_type:complete
MIVDLHFGKNKEFTLSYRLYNNTVSKRFFERLQQQENDLLSRTEFYNFGETVQDVDDKINSVVEQLVELKVINSSDDLNKLHEDFARYESEYTGSTQRLLWDLNIHIHHKEDLVKAAGEKRINITCMDSGEPLLDEAYGLFTLQKTYGVMYMGYPHVGKHLTELFIDNDIDIPAEQIVPTNLLANYMVCYLGEGRFAQPIHEDVFKLKLLDFYNKIAHKMPYKWGDKRLAIGNIPLGELQDKNVDISPLDKYKYVHSWTCR